MSDEAKQVNRLDLTPQQALGVALSCSPVWMRSNMDQCQEAAPKVLQHIRNMGYHLIHEKVLIENAANKVGSGSSCISSGELYAEVK